MTKERILEAVRRICRDEIVGILEDAYAEVAPPKLVAAARGES